MRRVPQKRDTAEAAIVDALRKTGWHVLKVSVKDGPDLFAARVGGQRARTVAIECKTGKQKLQKGQAEWHATWPGETAVLRSVDEALQLLRT